MRDVRSIYQYVFLASIVILRKPEKERGHQRKKELRSRPTCENVAKMAG